MWSRLARLRRGVLRRKDFAFGRPFDWVAFITATPWARSHPHHSLAFERGFDGIGGSRVRLRESVRVDVERSRHAGVADAAAHWLTRGTGAFAPSGAALSSSVLPRGRGASPLAGCSCPADPHNTPSRDCAPAHTAGTIARALSFAGRASLVLPRPSRGEALGAERPVITEVNRRCPRFRPLHNRQRNGRRYRSRGLRCNRDLASLAEKHRRSLKRLHAHRRSAKQREAAWVRLARAPPRATRPRIRAA